MLPRLPLFLTSRAASPTAQQMRQTINCLWKLNLSGLETREIESNQPNAALRPHPVRFFFPAWHESQSFVHSLAKTKVVTRRSSVLLFLALIFGLKYRSKRTNCKVDVFERFSIFFFFSIRVLIEAAVASDGAQDNFRSWQVFICFLNGAISHSVVPHGRLTAASSESWSRPAAPLSGREIISVESTVVRGLLPSLYCH